MNTYTPERVTLELTREQFHRLQITLKYAVDHASQSPAVLPFFYEIVNAINRGNPDWTPYEVPEAKT